MLSRAQMLSLPRARNFRGKHGAVSHATNYAACAPASVRKPDGGGEGGEKGVREKKEPGKTNPLINLINYSEV